MSMTDAQMKMQRAVAAGLDAEVPTLGPLNDGKVRLRPGG